jgi:hypothetical protein
MVRVGATPIGSDCSFKVFHGPDLAVPDEDVRGAVDLIFSAVPEACTVP